MNGCSRSCPLIKECTKYFGASGPSCAFVTNTKGSSEKEDVCKGCKHDGYQGLYCSPCQSGCEKGNKYEPIGG